MKKTLASLFVLATVLAWDASPIQAADPAEETMSAARIERLEAVRGKITDIRNSRLKKTLGLNEKQAGQLFGIMERHDRKKAELRRSLIGSMRELRQSVRRQNEPRMGSALDRLEETVRALQSVRDEERREIKQILSTEQQARYVLFQVAFAREVRKKVSQIRQERSGGLEDDFR